jgi:hypothetical protein
MLAGPMVLMYQVGIAIIWFINRGKKYSPKVKQLQAKDAETMAERQARLGDAKMIWEQADAVADHPFTAATDKLTKQPPRQAPPTILESVPVKPMAAAATRFANKPAPRVVDIAPARPADAAPPPQPQGRFVDSITKPKRRP